MLKLSLPSEFKFPGVTVDQTKTEYEIFFSNFRAVNHELIIRAMTNANEVVKSVYLSQINRQKGNEAYLLSDTKKALEFYYLSLAYAPSDSPEYALAIGNRSVGLFSMKKYEECLRDIDNILGTNYPEQLAFKIYIRQSVCFLKLGQHSKAFESISKARENLNQFKNTMTQSKYDKVQRQINKVFSQIKPYDANTIEFDLSNPPLKDGENPKFLNASNAVDLKYNDTVGRYVVAKTDIEKGDILFVEKPYSAVQVDDLKYRYTYCSNCFIYTPTTIPCDECIIHFYCSTNCKQMSWEKSHKWECLGVRKNIFTPAIRLPLYTMLKAAQNNFKTLVEDESVYGNKDDNFAFVDKLVVNKYKMTNEQICKFTEISIWLVIYLRENTNFFNWLHQQPNNLNKPIYELIDLTGGILLKLCMQIQCNYSNIIDASLANLEDFNIDFDFIGFGLYVSTSMINHSCAPNALVSFNQDLKIVRATKTIKKNTEITINYTSFLDTVETIGPSFILDTYKFTCTCTQCTDPMRFAENPWLCYRCQGKAFSFSENEATCSSCQENFCTLAYKHMEAVLFSLYLKTFSSASTVDMDNIFTLIKTIYHPHHEEFAKYYMLCYDLYIAQHDALKCLNSSKMFVQYCEEYCETNLLKLQSYLRLMNATAIYYGSMHKNAAPMIPNLENYFCEVLEKTEDFLKFFVSAQNIKCYDSSFRNYLMTYN